MKRRLWIAMLSVVMSGVLTFSTVDEARAVNTGTILVATVKQFWSCTDWAVKGACFWVRCSFFYCEINVTPKYWNRAPEQVIQAYHQASNEPISETTVINELNFGSSSNIIVNNILHAMGYWRSGLEGGAPSESLVNDHRNLSYTNVDSYGHPLLLMTEWDSMMDQSTWPDLPEPGTVDISDELSGMNLPDVYDIDDYNIYDPPWNVVDEWGLASNLSDTEIMDLYGLAVEYILPDGCVAENQPEMYANPNYGDAESTCSGIPGYGYSCTNITDEFLPVTTNCALKEVVPDLPSWDQIKQDFSPRDIAIANGSYSYTLTVGDTFDADDLSQVQSEFDLSSMIDYVFCTPENIAPWQPLFMSHRDLVSWRFGIPEMFYPQSLSPVGWELQDGLNNYGPYFPRSGFHTQHDPLKEGALAAFKAAHFITRENEPHVYTSTYEKTNKKQGRWPPQPIEQDSGGVWGMVYPRTESSCHYFPMDDKGSGWRNQEEASVYNLWRRYTCCQKDGSYLFDINFF